MEQTALFDSPNAAYTSGFVRGLNRTLARTGLGVFEIATFPLPPYHPIFTSYLSPRPAYPDNFKPGLVADSMYDTDTLVGFGGGDVAPKIPGSRFGVFGMH
jgi:putative exosortase-associated protein (TIGR04073 family)